MVALHTPRATTLHHPLRYGADGARWRSMEFGNLEIPYVFPIFQISLPWVISVVLFGGIVIPTLIKTVTLTYILTDIYIIILSINISCECIFSTTLRTGISCTSATVSL
jgi:hypothetical protein